MQTLSRKMALVTGASSGIGQAFARRLGKDGYDVVLVARRRPRLECLAAELREQYAVETEVLPADLTNPADVEWVERRICELADLELLVNSAGFATFGDFTRCRSSAGWRWCTATSSPACVSATPPCRTC